MSVNTSPKFRKQIWTFIVSKILFFNTRCSSGFLDYNSNNPVDFFWTGEHFFAQNQKKRISLYFIQKKSSAPLQCRCGNSAVIFLAFVHKQFAENPETILKLHSFSGIGFLPIGVPLDILTAIAATILKYFWQATNLFWLKTQKVVTRLFLSQKMFPPKRSSAHAECTGKCATAKFFNKHP